MEKSRERLLILFVCIVILGAAYVLLISVGFIDPPGDNSAAIIRVTDADSVVLQHEYAAGSNNAVVNAATSIADPQIITNILQLRNDMRLISVRGNLDKKRYALYFYHGDELVERWRVDWQGRVSFSGRHGVFTIENEDFDMEYIAGLLAEPSAAR